MIKNVIQDKKGRHNHPKYTYTQEEKFVIHGVKIAEKYRREICDFS